MKFNNKTKIQIVLVTLSLSSLSFTEATLLRVLSLQEPDTTVFTASCKWHRELIKKSPDGLEGLLISSTPPDACTEVLPPPPAPITNGSYPIDPNWFLMAIWPNSDRCTLLTKVTLADSAGYSAIVVQLSVNEDSAATFFAGDDWDYGLSIYPCLVSYEDGEKLKLNYSTNEDYIIHFEDESIDTWTRFFITSFLCLIALVLAIALSYCVFQMFILIVIWIRDTIVNALERRRINRRRRLPYRQLKKIPVQQWTNNIPQDMCTICLENYVPEKDKVRILPCSHVFHMQCIDPWLLNQRRKCPNCKRKIVFPDEPYDSDSSTEDERTPLIRRAVEGGSFDHSIGGGLTFTFNEVDFENHHQPIYRAIHRMMLESNARQRQLLDSRVQGENPSTSSSSSSSTTSSCPSNEAQSSHTDALRQAIRHKRLTRLAQRLLPSCRGPSINVDPEAANSLSPDYLEDTSAVQMPSTSAQSHNQFLAEATQAYEESLKKIEQQNPMQNSSVAIGGEIEEIDETGQIANK